MRTDFLQFAVEPFLFLLSTLHTHHTARGYNTTYDELYQTPSSAVNHRIYINAAVVCHVLNAPRNTAASEFTGLASTYELLSSSAMIPAEVRMSR